MAAKADKIFNRLAATRNEIDTTLVAIKGDIYILKDPNRDQMDASLDAIRTCLPSCH